MDIPVDYILQNIYAYCKRPYYKKNEGIYNAECNVCKEGSSAGSKRRLFYFPSEHYFYCFNCNRSWSEVDWLCAATSRGVSDLLRDIRQFVPDACSNSYNRIYEARQSVGVKKGDVPVLPEDSIDICDERQIDYYAEDECAIKVIERATEYCTERRLFTAVNRPSTFYLSIKDEVHCNRLIIPFSSEQNRIESYQSRSLYSHMQPKYLTKYGEKCFYGESSISPEIPYLFVLEGPIDAMFVRNGIGMGGAKPTERQHCLLDKHFDKKIIYIFDNDADNKEMYKNIIKHISRGCNVFIWPKELSKYKDFNDICCDLCINEISTDFILKNTYSGVEAAVKYKTALKLR